MRVEKNFTTSCDSCKIYWWIGKFLKKNWKTCHYFRSLPVSIYKDNYYLSYFTPQVRQVKNISKIFFISWNYGIFLRIVHSKILWLLLKWHSEPYNCSNNVFLIIERNYFIWFCKKERVWELSTNLRKLKVELHAKVF